MDTLSRRNKWNWPAKLKKNEFLIRSRFRCHVFLYLAMRRKIRKLFFTFGRLICRDTVRWKKKLIHVLISILHGTVRRSYTCILFSRTRRIIVRCVLGLHKGQLPLIIDHERRVSFHVGLNTPPVCTYTVSHISRSGFDDPLSQ